MDYEKGEISIQEIKIYQTLVKNKERFMSNHEIKKQVPDISLRTIRLHTMRLNKLGIIDVVEVYPGHRFKLSAKANKRNQSYILRLEKAEKAFTN